MGFALESGAVEMSKLSVTWQEYAAMAAKRIREDAPLFTEVETDARP